MKGFQNGLDQDWISQNFPNILRTGPRFNYTLFGPGPVRASIRPSEAKARKPYDKTEFRTEFSGS